MKEFRCPHCARTTEKEDNITMIKCICGHYMKIVNRGLMTNDFSKDDQVILKTVFNRGVVSGKPRDASQILEEVFAETKGIKVNLK